MADLPDEARPAVLHLRDVHVRFDTHHAVNGVSFDLHPGQLLGLIGPNGAGKTTLLRSIVGLQAAEGDLQLMGERIAIDRLEVIRQIGFTPDTPPVYEDLTVRQFLEFIGRGYGLPRAETAERIDFWLERVWLTEKANQKIKTLSRGMKQRVGIARTLLPNPVLILLDEPAGGLDPAGRAQFRQLLCSLRDQGKVLIVSSHILSDLSEYCTHVGIMSGGRMVRFGSVDGFMQHADETRRLYRIELAQPVAHVRRVFESIDGIESLTIHDSQRIELTFAADRAAATTLLQQLLAAGLPVSSFMQPTVDLEQAYLREGIRQVE